MIYYRNDQDGVLLDKHGAILCFYDRESLEQHARRKRVKLRAACESLDLDRVSGWTEHLGRMDLDCPSLYQTWNLLGDIATSLGRGAEYLGYDIDYESIHEELFWGCNLPGPGSSSGNYKPRLTDEELDGIRTVFRQGLGIVSDGMAVLRPV